MLLPLSEMYKYSEIVKRRKSTLYLISQYETKQCLSLVCYQLMTTDIKKQFETVKK